MTRPEGLPEFGQPPLNEVVLGVQFAPPEGYHQLLAGDVWKLFKAAYPVTAENSPLAPVFETFGPPGTQQVEFSFNAGIQHPRYWFLSRDGNELIQFQADRFLHNWRQVPGSVQPYPRFDTVVAKFQKEFLQLSDYFQSLQTHRPSKPVVCNQVEVTYINHIAAPKGKAPDPSPFVKIFDFGSTPPDDLGMIWRRVLHRPDGSPYARLQCDMQSAINHKGENIFVLNITVRGNPSVGTIGNVIEFMKKARETIVSEFANITTDSAHEAWERIV